MGMIARGPFPLGWVPDADATNTPAGSLLRMDNLILDELGILSLRRGSTYINDTPFDDLDVHSLHTQNLNGTRYRMAGAGSHVYANGTKLPQLMDGSGDVSFGTHMGQIFYARGETKLKYDGTVRVWGVVMSSNDPPTIAPGVGSPSNSSTELISGDSTESPALFLETGSSLGFTADRNGVSNAALDIATDNGQAYFTKTFVADQDLTQLGSSNFPADDNSELSFWAYFADPSKIFQISVQISVNGPTIWSDEYATIFFISEMATDGKIAQGWNKLTRRRGDMVRGGPGTPGQGWDTVRMVRIVISCFEADPGAIYFDELRMSGVASGGSVLSGSWQWAYVYVNNNGSYIAYSEPSAFSEYTRIDSDSATVTVPADINRDSQINQIWVFRRGENLPGWYRTAVYDPGGAVGTGSIDITDAVSDEDALETNIIMDEDTDVPPDSIIGIEGPYYDRLFALTATHLYPSRRLAPDNFAVTQVIRIAGPDEQALWVKKAFGGLYIGTTKDIYRVDGTGAELPDGTTEFQKTPLNIDNPPISNGVAQEGSLLVYLASDGWRAFNGAGSQPLAGTTSLLYQGEDRHGVEAVNVKEGRFRAAMDKSQLVAITPEGDNDDDSQVLYRHAFKSGLWYRHSYLHTFLSIFREPDGTLIAGDDAGHVIILDNSTQDVGNPISVTIWTSQDDDKKGYTPKKASNLSINVDTDGDEYTVQVMRDDTPELTLTLTGATDYLSPVAHDISSLDLFRQVQLRLTGDFSRFRFDGFSLSYLGLPRAVKAWDSGPLDIGVQDIVWVRRVKIKARAAGDLTVTPYFDGIAFDPIPVEVLSTQQDLVTFFDVPLPRAYFGRTPRFVVQSSENFHPYWVEILVRQTMSSTEKKPVRMQAGLGGEEAA